ncbi:hypothetical protein OJAV_G00027600 [Oryzias javanicus]|uniref:Uncharacterized protein n=1 Tax=Oryzias javanicus TaxID=123683 RepID=A0A3S2Q0D1_ORYJA|nr:hypothetical protein OJAV_G00027600 [Oryzias javanicus]
MERRCGDPEESRSSRKLAMLPRALVLCRSKTYEDHPEDRSAARLIDVSRVKRNSGQQAWGGTQRPPTHTQEGSTARSPESSCGEVRRGVRISIGFKESCIWRMCVTRGSPKEVHDRSMKTEDQNLHPDPKTKRQVHRTFSFMGQNQQDLFGGPHQNSSGMDSDETSSSPVEKGALFSSPDPQMSGWPPTTTT